MTNRNAFLEPDKRFDGLVEVVDDASRPLALIPKDAAHRQLLYHKSVLVLIFDPDNKIYLQKRSRKKQFYPGRWDVSASTHTEPGESFSEAAVRVVRDKLGLETDRLHFVRQLPACPETGFEFVSIFALHRNTLTITPNPEAVDEGYYYSREELTCLVRNFRELLTPQLVTLWETGTIDS